SQPSSLSSNHQHLHPSDQEPLARSRYHRIPGERHSADFTRSGQIGPAGGCRAGGFENQQLQLFRQRDFSDKGLENYSSQEESSGSDREDVPRNSSRSGQLWHV